MRANISFFDYVALNNEDFYANAGSLLQHIAKRARKTKIISPLVHYFLIWAGMI